jgi:DNA-binding FadR family transcriptional regulator
MVAARIREFILENALQAGDPLPTEQEMAERFGASRICVREATKALSLLGILNPTRRWGTTIGDGRDMSQLCQYAGLRFAVSDYSTSELLDARLVIEIGVLPAVLARMAGDPAVAESLEAGSEAMADVLDDPVRAAACDLEFHTALVRAGGNGPLLSFCNMLQAFFRQVIVDRVTHGTTGKRPVLKRVMDDHRGIFEALKRNEQNLAEGLLRRHIGRYREHAARPESVAGESEEATA